MYWPLPFYLLVWTTIFILQCYDTPNLLLTVKRLAGERGFFYSGPAAWNTLPSGLHDITDTSTFRKRLKNVLFDRAFDWFYWRSWTCRIAAPYKFRVDWLIDRLTIPEMIYNVLSGTLNFTLLYCWVTVSQRYYAITLQYVSPNVKCSELFH